MIHGFPAPGTRPPLWRIIAAIVALVLFATTASAQETPGPDATAAEAEVEAPAYPAGLDDPTISLEELQLRLLPLTADELAALADAWQGIVKDETSAIVDQTLLLAELPDGQKDAARARIVDLTDARGKSFAKYSAVVTSLEKKGGDEAAVAGYRAYRNAIVVEEKQKADWQTLAKQGLKWATAPEGGIRLATRVAVVGVAVIALMLVARIVRGYARRAFGRVPHMSKLLQGFLAMVVYWIVIAIGLMVVLSALGVDITPLFALVGGGAFILAFALQDTLGNLAAGLMIMINRPFDEGDYVNVAGTGGTVKNVSIVSTTVTTPDNQVIVIPNGKVWGDVITNVTASATRRVDMVFGIGYEESIEEAQKVLEEVVLNHPKVLADPAPVIRVNELADSSVNFVVRPWARSADYFDVYWDITRQVKEAFDARGISIPFPQSELNLKMTDAIKALQPVAPPPAT